jgi:NADH:ubiquinone oxidoreductase subunit 5 (subunit L)/multisubunit Na+/H+ antiporter MnhA subunit
MKSKLKIKRRGTCTHFVWIALALICLLQPTYFNGFVSPLHFNSILSGSGSEQKWMIGTGTGTVTVSALCCFHLYFSSFSAGRHSNEKQI